MTPKMVDGVTKESDTISEEFYLADKSTELYDEEYR